MQCFEVQALKRLTVAAEQVRFFFFFFSIRVATPVCALLVCRSVDLIFQRPTTIQLGPTCAAEKVRMVTTSNRQQSGGHSPVLYPSCSLLVFLFSA